MRLHRHPVRRAAVIAVFTLLPPLLSAPTPSQSVIRVPQMHATIAAALARATPGTTILVSPGVYRENLIWPAVDGIRLVSLEGPLRTAIDGGGLNPVIQVGPHLSRATVIQGFTITNGFGPAGSGLLVHSSIVVRENVITKCAGRTNWNRGTGLLVVAPAFPLIERNRIVGNTMPPGSTNGAGAGIHIESGAGAEVISNYIVGNICRGTTSAVGGGIYIAPLTGSGVLIANNVIAQNAVTGFLAHGGGIYAGSKARILGNTIVRNTSGNTTNGQGGGIFLAASGSVCKNNIVALNSVAGFTGAGITCGVLIFATIDSNNVWSNTPTDFFGCSAGPNGVSLDPRFSGPGDYRLGPGSPCIEAGDPAAFAGPANRDFEGDPRRLDGDLDGPNGDGARIDLGADEFSLVTLQANGRGRMGTTLRLDVRASSLSANYAIAISTGTAGVLIGSFGDLLLAPPLAVIAVGRTPATPTASLPYLPALDGLPVHLQGLVYRTIGGQTVGQLTQRVDLILSIG